MKKDIHPELRPVVFIDASCGAEFPTYSTMKSSETKEINGVEHYVVKVEISSASHGFYTGEQRLIDTGGRIERFQKKYAKAQNNATSK